MTNEEVYAELTGKEVASPFQPYTAEPGEASPYIAEAITPAEVVTANVSPTWAAAAHMFCVVLENGTEEGKAMARSEVLRMGKLLDTLREEMGTENEKSAG